MTPSKIGPILLLVGTQTGNADALACEIESHLISKHRSCQLVDMADAYPEMLEDWSTVVIVTSTWGDGELPDNALDLYEGLVDLRPDLSHIDFGIVGLGDHYYDPHFCAAAGILHSLLTELGARSLSAFCEIDEGPSELDVQKALDWTDGFSEKLEAEALGISGE